MATRSEPMSRCGVHLVEEEHRENWKRLSGRLTVPTRVPSNADTGSVNNVELHLMLCLLNGKSNLLRHHIPAHWERIAKGATGAICCGSHITRICHLFDIELNEQEVIPGNQYLIFEALHNMEVIKIDHNKRAYVFQSRRRDHFPLPCPSLTHINGWEDKSNWKMDTTAHSCVVTTYPFTGSWKMHVTPVSSPVIDPGAEAESSRAHEQNMDEDGHQP